MKLDECSIKVLLRSKLFQGISDTDIPGMLSCLNARKITIDKGSYLIQEGDSAEYVGVLLSGELEISSTDYYGNRNIMARILPGDLYGETIACAGIPASPVSVMALCPSEALLLNCNQMIMPCNKACDFHNRLITNLLQILADKNLNFQRKLQITSKRTTREKLLTFLMLEAKRQGKASFTIGYDRQSLADFLGVDRSAMSTELSKLQKDGILTTKKNHFTLHSPDLVP